MGILVISRHDISIGVKSLEKRLLRALIKEKKDIKLIRISSYYFKKIIDSIIKPLKYINYIDHAIVIGNIPPLSSPLVRRKVRLLIFIHGFVEDEYNYSLRSQLREIKLGRLQNIIMDYLNWRIIGKKKRINIFATV